MAYATRTKLTQLGLPTAALADVSTTDQDAALDGASGIADGYLRKRYSLPLATYGDDLTTHVCSIAAWLILKTRGFNPEDPADAAIRMGYEDAIEWLESVAAGDIDPQNVTDATPTTAKGVAQAWSDTERGWNSTT